MRGPSAPSLVDLERLADALAVGVPRGLLARGDELRLVRLPLLLERLELVVGRDPQERTELVDPDVDGLPLLLDLVVLVLQQELALEVLDDAVAVLRLAALLRVPQEVHEAPGLG